MTALYVLNEPAIAKMGAMSDNGVYFAAYLLETLENGDVLRVMDREAFASKVWDLYVNSGDVLSVREAVLGALDSLT